MIPFLVLAALIVLAIPLIALSKVAQVEDEAIKRRQQRASAIYLLGTFAFVAALSLLNDDSITGPVGIGSILAVLTGLTLQYSAGNRLGEEPPGPTLRQLVFLFFAAPILVALAISMAVT